MTWDLSLPNLLGLTAGLAMVGVGTFVLLARPGATLNRLYFLLTLCDGASTILFRLSRMTDDPSVGATAYGLYWYYFAGFVALLAVFGFLFPHPQWRTARTWFVCAAAAGGAATLMAIQAVSPESLWAVVQRDGAIRYPLQPLANLAQTAFVVVVGLVAAKLTLDLRRTRSESRRQQSAFVLGGMTLAYAPYAWTYAVQAALLTPAYAYAAGPWDIVLSYWAFLALVAVMLGSAAALARDRRPELADERRFVLGCYGGVLATAGSAAAFPSTFVVELLQNAALLAYPLLLGFAIVRYEVFDIDTRLRRAATATIVAAGLAATFILGESALEGVLQDRLSGIPSEWAAGAVAALATTLVSIPLVRASRRLASRIVPELTVDELDARKLEVYRHAVEGALADGLVNERESSTLRALRAALEITDAQHERVLADVLAARSAHPAASNDAVRGAA